MKKIKTYRIPATVNCGGEWEVKATSKEEAHLIATKQLEIFAQKVKNQMKHPNYKDVSHGSMTTKSMIRIIK